MAYSTLISNVLATIPIVDKQGMMHDHFRAFTTQVARCGLIIGTGVPEGFVEATVGRFYMDQTGSAGSLLYIKRDDNIAGDKTKGWILV